MGALYLQDAVCALPARPDLEENLGYVATSIREFGGTARVFSSRDLLPDGDPSIVDEFRMMADRRYRAIAERIESIESELSSGKDVEGAEDLLKRERVAFLRARRIAYFGSDEEEPVRALLDRLRSKLDEALQGAR